ncbi:GAF and ANTAR domain-containing protein [Herbidospora galbida]|uniref:GAF and ANTAR domain-containing protein n=1 Tax=Herbidospora galbida TaxID=2575442 RepID=A0A4U3MJD9_9ACTN|nr:GAF and ANTAR domain-containing protein [Herbidospora galbida]TKK89505.1 GAF and ANTAR domain-containing protein [Herbidospora galbida]
MEQQRTSRVWGLVFAHARADGQPISIDTICHACADAFGATAVTIALTGDLAAYDPVSATGPAAQLFADLQVTFGEGPGLAALADRRTVLVPDLDATETAARWPVFAPAAVKAGIRSVHVFPLLLGAITVGVLEIGHAQPRLLTPDEIGDALVFADAALLIQTHQLVNPGGGPTALELGRVERWAEVHQATGMVAAQIDADLTTAFVRLRAHAYVAGRSLREVAHDVVARTLRLEPWSDNRESED